MPGIRSKAYPIISLGAAVKRAELVQKNIGGGYFDREAIAKGMGYKSLSGISTRTVAALAHYGLLNRKKAKYSLSDLANHIIMPISDDDRRQAVLTALKEPELYRELIGDYDGKNLPATLPNVLAHNHGINPHASSIAAQAFIESLSYAGVLKGEKLEMKGTTNGLGAEVSRGEPDDLKPVSTTGGAPVPGKGLDGQVIIRKLPSGIQIGFPPVLDYAVMTGAFSEEIKNIENKAQSLKSKSTDETDTDEEAQREL